MLFDIMDTTGETTVFIKFLPKRRKLFENLEEQILKSEHITPNKIYTKRWTVRGQ